MHWDYRIVLLDDAYTLCEVYYSKVGNPKMYSVVRTVADQEDYWELVEDLCQMQAATNKPLLRYPKDFTGESSFFSDQERKIHCQNCGVYFGTSTVKGEFICASCIKEELIVEDG